MYHVGIDWSDQKYDISIVDDGGDVITPPIEIAKNQKGFAKLLLKLRTISGNPSDFRMGIETPHNLLVDFFVELGYPVYAIFPGSMESFRKRYRSSRARDDQFDAFVLADVLRTDTACWRRVDFGSELAREIRLLAYDHHTFTDNRVALNNSLRSTLNAYYPEYIEFFRDIACKTSLAFIQVYPDFESASKLIVEQINDFFKEQHYNNSKTVNKIYALLQQKPIKVAKPLLDSKKFRAITLAKALQQVTVNIEAYLKKLSKLVEQHPDGEMFLSYPAVSHINAARLIAVLSDNRALFDHVSEVQALTGTAPVTEKSGNYKVTFFRRACNKFNRDVMHQIAFSSLTKCQWAKSYYQNHRHLGKKHSHALRCLANVHLKILFAMWKNRTCYDENIFLAQRARHQLSMMA
jgi:transposase